MKRKARKIEIPQEAELAIQRGNKVEAARLIRIHNGLSLLDAQRAVESFIRSNKQQPQAAQATGAETNAIADVQVWLPLLIALVAVFPFLYQAIAVLAAGSMAGRCVDSPFAICQLGPVVGDAVFGAANAHLGYVVLMGLIAASLLGLAYRLYKR